MRRHFPQTPTQDFAMTETNASARKPKIAIEASIRGWADVLCLWRFCRKAQCAKMRACRGGNVRRCFHAHFLLLPEAVRVWFDELGEAQEEGLSYDQAIERMEEPELRTALEDWHRTVAYCDKVLSAKTLAWLPPKAGQ
jgi:hypothetical protein